MCLSWGRKWQLLPALPPHLTMAMIQSASPSPWQVLLPSKGWIFLFCFSAFYALEDGLVMGMSVVRLRDPSPCGGVFLRAIKLNSCEVMKQFTSWFEPKLTGLANQQEPCLLDTFSRCFGLINQARGWPEAAMAPRHPPQGQWRPSPPFSSISGFAVHR